jgi:hypothetical protein
MNTGEIFPPSPNAYHSSCIFLSGFGTRKLRVIIVIKNCLMAVHENAPSCNILPGM